MKLRRCVSIWLSAWLLLMTPAWAASRQVMRGHVPAAVAHLQPMGDFAGTNRLNLAIGLPLRNQEALTNLLRQIYDPASPKYHHYLTPEQFTRMFGPTKKDYRAVIAFAKANRLTVTATHPNRMLVDVSGSVADIERALHMTLREYQHPTEKRMFHAPDAEPSLNLAVPILSISGLDNYLLPRPRLQATPLANASKALPNTGSGPGGTYMGKDFRAAYVPDSLLNGSGQIVGLLQFDGYTASDITYYENQAGLPSITLSNVLIDGATGSPSGGGGEVEVSLDIEMAISMATNLSKVIVYMAPNPSPWEDLLNRMANDNLAKQLSCSWYQPGGAAKPTADAIFQQMAAQGQSFFNASGDYDAYTGLIDFPGDTPYLTQVGGTTLTTSGTVGAWASETVWNRGNGIGSGGGISTQYAIPSWQMNINMTANQGSTTMRNTPDVALTAESVYVRANGMNYTVGGTSCAAPLWAGFAALINQQAAASSKPAVGFINPAVDAIGSGANYSSAFHDITTGNNTRPGSSTKFYAVSSYDLCTGWGTPAGQSLINALVNPEALLITPAMGFSSIGGVGGPFTITSQSLSLTNAGTNSLTWTLANTSVWLNATPSGGTLTPGGAAATVTVSLNTAASNLVVGTYNATLWFTNLNSGVGQSRQFILSVISPPAITTQPTNQAVLDGAAATFTVGVTGGLPLYYRWRYNGTNLADGGNISGSATTNLTINSVSAANVGTYSVIVSNAAGVATSSNASLTITPSPPVIIMQPIDKTVVVNRTAQFIVAVLGTKPFSYQWSFDGTNIDGATNAILTLTNVQLSQAGAYAVVITNIYDSITSSNAVLTVLLAPPCDPAPSGIVSWWPGEGNGLDIVGANNGVLEGGLGFAFGEVGQAFFFNNTNADFKVPASSSLNVGAGNGFTLETWINPSDISQLHPLFEWNVGDGVTYWGVHFYISASGVGSLYANVVDSGGGWHSIHSATEVITNDVFQHVALTYDKASGVATIYCNGAVVAQQNLGSFTPQTTYDLYLGRRPGPDSILTFAGLLDEPSIYNRALSSNEIVAIYNAGSGGKCPPTPAPPAITTQPTNQTVTVGGAVSFSVVASGTLPLSYQWNFNGTNIVGATNPLLTLTNVQLNQAGNYTVLVTNAYGSILSSNAVLTVIPASSCTPPPSGLISWWPGEGNGNDIIGTNNGSPTGGISYSNGEVGQAFAFNTTNAAVKVAASPTLDVGAGAGFTVESWINPSDLQIHPIVEWNNGTGSYGVHFYIDVSGVGNLYANIVSSSGSGHVIQTGSGVVMSNVFQHVALTYDKASGVAKMYCNGVVVVQQTVGSFTPQTTYDLYLGRRPLTGGETLVYAGLMDELSLYSRALSSNEIAAIYIAGSGGKCPPTPPAITTQPTNQTVAVGGTAMFNVTATGTTPLSYQWNFNGTNIVGATNTTLTLTNVQLSQAGNYAVLVTNAYGSLLSSNALLTVNPASTNCDPAPAGLISWWPGEGDAHDIIGTNNGILENVTFTNGRVGQGFYLNGSNADVQIPYSTSLQPTSVTVEAWVKLDALASPVAAYPGLQYIIFKKNSRSGLFEGYDLEKNRINGQDVFRFQVTSSGGQQVPAASITVPQAGVWYHLAGTYDQSSGYVQLYVNGVLEGSAYAGFPLDYGTRPVFIGTSGEGWDGKVQGMVDEVSIYNRALSSNEIAAIYTAGSGGKCPPTPTPPAITTQPTNQTVAVGGTAMFNVTATGTPPLSFQWNFNGTNIVGATNTLLTLTNVQMSQAGNYTVLVTNLYGSILSSNAVLTVNLPPPCTPAPSGLVDWWPGEGNANDVIGTNHGTLLGGASYVAGEVGRAFSFNGTSGYVNVPDSPSLDSLITNITVELWMKAGQTNANSDWKGIVTKGNTSWRFLATSFAKTVYFGASGVSPDLYGTRNVNDGQWHHVAATYDGTNMFLYVDGTVDVSTPATGLIVPNSEPVCIGADSGAWTGTGVGLGYFFNGFIDEASIYNRALSSNEIAAIYTAGSWGKCPPASTPPAITTQPTNQTVAVGGTAIFNVTAAGTPPLSFQWNFNGTNIVGATNTLLTLTNVQMSQAGNYTVLVTNAYGSTLSSNAVLTVNLPPPCTPAPSGLVDWWPGEGNANDVIGTNHGTLLGGASYVAGEVGQAFSFDGTSGYVNVPDSPSLDSLITNITVELWMKAGQTNANSDWKGIVTKGGSVQLDATTSDKTVYLNLDGLSPSSGLSGTRNVNDGQWHHVAGVYDGTNMFLYVDGTLDVSQPATGLITQNSYPVCLGANAQAWTGHGVGLGYFFNGFIDEASIYNRALSSDEIAAIYNAGSWGKCPPASTPPAITRQPTNQTVAVGGTATFAVVASGTPPLSFQWNFNGTNIVGATNTMLMLTNVQMSQAGNYTVLVTNLFGSALSSNAVLTVGTPPTIITQPTNQTVVVGGTAAFTVVVDGSVPLSYQWNFNGTNLTDDARIAGSTTSSLSISNVQASDAGNYTITVTNLAGSTTSTSAVLTVLMPPSVTTQPIGRSVPPGLPTVFNAAVSGTSPFYFQWQLNGANIPGATDSSYIIAAVGTNDLGIYHLVVSNALGVVVSADAQLTFGPVAAWGRNSDGECLPPPGLSNVFAVAGSYGASFAARSDGTIAVWGSGTATNIPASASNVVAISSGGIVANYALRSDGTVVGWPGTGAPALSNIVSVAAQYNFSYALRAEGTLTNWGSIPTPSFPAGLNHLTAIACGFNNALALQADGTVVVSGSGVVTNVPAGLTNVVAIAAGYSYAMALKANGTVVAWGSGMGTNLPAGMTNIVAISAVDYLSENFGLAIRSNGTVVVWGDNPYGETSPPAALSNLVSIAGVAAANHGLALVNDGSPVILHPPIGLTVYAGRDITLQASAVGAAPLSYQWLFNGTNISGATNTSLVISNVQFGNAGNYQLFVSNSVNTALSLPAPLTVVSNNALTFLSVPTGQTNYQGGKVSLGVTVLGNGPLRYQWFFSTTNKNYTTVAGATNDTLNLDPALAVQSGNYYIAVSNQIAGITSSPVNIKVLFARAWGFQAVANPPVNVTNAIAIATGGYNNYYGHYFALGSDGKLTSWANYPVFYGETNVSALSNSFVTAIAAGYEDSLALRSDGTVYAWGYGYYGQTNPPSGLNNVVAIACGDYHDLALKSDGTVIAWGQNTYGQATNNPAATNVVAIAAGGQDSIALRADGSAVTWGYYGSGQFPVPSSATNIVAIAAGGSHFLALRANGTVVGWGNNGNGQVSIPAGLSNIVAISASGSHSTLLRADGTVVALGSEYAGYASNMVPADLVNVIAISSGGDHDFGLLGARAPAFTIQPLSRTVFKGTTNVLLAAKVVGVQPVTYQWRFNGANLSGATNDTLSLTNLQFAQAGTYQLVASNAYGVTLSKPAKLVVTIPLGEALDATYLVWTTSGNAPWYGQTNVTHDGVDAARSGAIGALQETILQTTVATNWPGRYTFWWKVSSEQYFDILEFRVNGIVQTNISGEVDWQQVSIPVAAGTNVLQWRYSKDVSYDAGQDAGWVDQFAFISGPVIIQQPVSRTNSAGTTANFFAFANGLSQLSYQWQKNGVNLANGGNVSGANTPNLFLSNVQDADAASYTIVVTNLGGSVTSSPAMLVVIDPPAITLQPMSRTVNMGADVQFNVTAIGYPPLAYQWWWNGTNPVGVNSSTFTLTGVGRAQNGVYSVVVSNPAGGVPSSNAVLKVLVPQKLGTPVLLPDGTLQLTSGDADGGLLSASDLANFEARMSTNLVDWVPLTNVLSLTNGMLQFQDPGSTNAPMRFYRILEH